MKKFGNRVKELRTHKGLSQRDLADKMNYDHSTIGRIERGLIDVPQSRVKEFAKVLGVTPAYLMGTEDLHEVKLDRLHREMIADKDMTEIYYLYRALDDRKKKAVKDLIHSMID